MHFRLFFIPGLLAHIRKDQAYRLLVRLKENGTIVQQGYSKGASYVQKSSCCILRVFYAHSAYYSRIARISRKCTGKVVQEASQCAQVHLDFSLLSSCICACILSVTNRYQHLNHVVKTSLCALFWLFF